MKVRAQRMKDSSLLKKKCYKILANISKFLTYYI